MGNESCEAFDSNQGHESNSVDELFAENIEQLKCDSFDNASFIGR